MLGIFHLDELILQAKCLNLTARETTHSYKSICVLINLTASRQLLLILAWQSPGCIYDSQVFICTEKVQKYLCLLALWGEEISDLVGRVCSTDRKLFSGRVCNFFKKLKNKTSLLVVSDFYVKQSMSFEICQNKEYLHYTKNLCYL